MLVHHANQLLITDGYADRDGITPVADAVTDLVRLHDRHGVPCSLHLSGTLVEALAWHRPDVLDLVRVEAANGLLELVGGAYGEPVLPLLTDAAVVRHLRLTAVVMERHLQAAPTSAWVPERVWHPRLGPLLHAAGYERTALDDRLLVAPAGRPALDATGPWAQRADRLDPALCRPVVDLSGLLVAPISAPLRYLVPPRGEQDLELLSRLAAPLPDDAVLLYADDLERTCGVAGWEPAMDRYADFVSWVAGHPGLDVRRLDELEATQETAVLGIEAGTYYELAHDHGAGETYDAWAQDVRWQPYAEVLVQVEDAVDGAPPTARTTQLAERLLLVGQHETAWQDLEADGGRAPAPWACATAAHAREALPVLAVGRWARAGGCDPVGLLLDVDEDGHDEVLLADRTSWCLISPRAGGRVTLLGVREDDQARVVVGNPLDHWNFQIEPHLFMHTPAAHPGAFAAHGAEDEPWTVTLPEADEELARVVLTRPGARRTLALVGGRLLLCWDGQGPVGIESHLSPDHLAAVENGRAGVRVDQGPGWARIQAGLRSSWCGWDREASATTARCTLASHGMPVAVQGAGHLDLVIGTGGLPRRIDAELARLRERLHADALLGPVTDVAR